MLVLSQSVLWALSAQRSRFFIRPERRARFVWWLIQEATGRPHYSRGRVLLILRAQQHFTAAFIWRSSEGKRGPLRRWHRAILLLFCNSIPSYISHIITSRADISATMMVLLIFDFFEIAGGYRCKGIFDNIIATVFVHLLYLSTWGLLLLSWTFIVAEVCASPYAFLAWQV